LAKNLNLPVLPMYISGSERVLPKGSYIPARSKVELVVGEPFYVEEGDDLRSVAKETRDKIQNLRTENQYNKKLQENQ